MSTALRPTTDLVGIAWLRLVPGLPAQQINTALPKDVSVLRTVGFVRVAVVGGSPNLEVPLRRPVLSVECWAAPAEGSQKVPWGRASNLAENVLAATYDRSLMGRLVDLTPWDADYLPARVLTVNALSEPTRVEGDPSGFARFDLDVELNWTGASS